MMEGVFFIQDLAVIMLTACVAGWICQRVGVSVVVGYLATGIFLGPHFLPESWSFTFLQRLDYVKIVADMGLVLLIFSIGMNLSLRRLRSLGVGLVVATFVGAGLVFYLTRSVGVVFGMTGMETMFLAGMLMVSSSAIIGKVLQELGTGHERSSQLAMGVTVLEDAVSVMMLTLLGALVASSGTGGGMAVAGTLGLFGLFVVFAGVCFIIFVPRLLKRLSVSVSEELQTLGIGALLLGVAVLAFRAGYSMALGAFLLGVIVAETRHRFQVDRIFAGMRDVFSAVFFVSIGLQINLVELADVWGWILGVTVFTFLARVFAVSAGLTLTGVNQRDALRAGLTATPIGEFSFIIAQLGVAKAAVPASFYPLAVGLSFTTSLLSPVLMRHSGRVADVLLKWEPRWLGSIVAIYHDWLESVEARRRGSVLWRLSQKRFLQVGVEMAFVTGLLVFSMPMIHAIEGWLGENWLFENGVRVVFGFLLGLLVLVPLAALWRNVLALAILYSELMTSNAGPTRNALAAGIRLVAAAGILIWLSALLPFGAGARWLTIGSIVVLVVILFLLRRRLVYWHSGIEVEVQGVLGGGGSKQEDADWKRRQDEWSLSVTECVLPDLAACQGKSIGELNLRALFGCTVTGIERQGFMISLPSAAEVLYPRDKLLLSGTARQVADAGAFLEQISTEERGDEFADVSVEALAVAEGSPAVGLSLKMISPAQVYGVQIAGVNRANGERVLNPSGEEVLRVGDEVLALGSLLAVRRFREWLEGDAEEKAEG